MIRNLKALGLALIAVFAMSATAAQAQTGLLTSDGPVTGYGTEISGETNAFTVFGQTFECPGSIFTIHKYRTTPHEFVSSGATTFTVTPHYEAVNHSCGTATGLFITVHMNNCDFDFHIGETTEKAGTYGVKAAVNCESSAQGYIALEIFTDTSEEVKACEIRIPGSAFNQDLTGAHLTNNGEHVDLTGTFTGLHMSRTPGLCGAVEKTTNGTTVPYGTYQVAVTLRGTNEEGGTTPISISHN
jgi:hypothetical protein